jgi:hypothetical protein
MWLHFDLPVGADSYFGRRQWQTPGLCYLKDPDAFYIGSWPTLLEVAENFENFDFSKVVVTCKGRLHYEESLPSVPTSVDELRQVLLTYGNWRIGAANWDPNPAHVLRELFEVQQPRPLDPLDDDSVSLGPTLVDDEEAEDGSRTMTTAPESIASEMFEEPWQDATGGYDAVIKRFWRKNMYDFGAGSLFETRISLRRKVVQDIDLDYPSATRYLFVNTNNVRVEIFPFTTDVFHADDGRFPRLYQTRQRTPDPFWFDARRVDPYANHFSDVHAILQALNTRMFILLEDRRPFMWLSPEHIYRARLRAQTKRLVDSRSQEARQHLFFEFRHGVSNFHFATLLLAMNLRVIYSRIRDSVVAYYITGSRAHHPVNIRRVGHVLHYDEDDLVAIYRLFSSMVVLLDAPPQSRRHFCANYVNLFERCIARDIYPDRLQSAFELLRISFRRRVIFVGDTAERPDVIDRSFLQTSKVLRLYRRAYGDDAIEPQATRVGVYNLPAPLTRDGSTADYPDVGACVFTNFDITIPALEAGTGHCAVKLVNCDLRRINHFTRAGDLLKAWRKMDAIQGFSYFSLVGCVRNRTGPKFPVYHVENFGVVKRETLVELHRQRAFIGFHPLSVLRFVAVNAGTFIAAYFSFQIGIDALMDRDAIRAYEPGFCYRRVTDAELGAWPTLEEVLAHATKNLHLAVTSNGMWCHIHTYALSNGKSVLDLKQEYMTSRDSSRWQKRVGAEVPVVVAEPVEELHREGLHGLSLTNYKMRIKLDELLVEQTIMKKQLIQIKQLLLLLMVILALGDTFAPYGVLFAVVLGIRPDICPYLGQSKQL